MHVNRKTSIIYHQGAVAMTCCFDKNMYNDVQWYKQFTSIRQFGKSLFVSVLLTLLEPKYAQIRTYKSDMSPK